MTSLLKLLAACSLISMDLASLAAVEVGTAPPPVTATAELPAWMATIQAELLQSPDQVTTLSPTKITGLLFTTTATGFSDKLLELRDAHPDDFQFIYVSNDLDRVAFAAHLHLSRSWMPAVPSDSPIKSQLKQFAGVDGGIPKLVIFDPAGTVITRRGFRLLDDPTAPITIGAGDPAALARWHRMMGVGQGRQAFTPAEQDAELRRSFGTTRGWAAFEKAVINDEGRDNTLKIFEDLGREIGSGGHWDDLLALFQLTQRALDLTGGERLNCVIATLHCARESGRHARDRQAMFTAMRPWMQGELYYARQAALLVIAEQLARENDAVVAADFWKALDGGINSSNSEVLSPLLVVGDERAYAYVRKAAASRDLSFLVKHALQAALAAKRPEAIALFAQLVKDYPEFFHDGQAAE